MIPSWEVRLEIFNKWQSGETQKSLGDKYNISISRVSQICQDTKIRLKKGWKPEEAREPGRPSEGKQKKSVSFDPDIWEQVKDLGWGERSRLMNQAIREYLAK